MTTLATTPTTPITRATRTSPAHPVTFPRIVAAEWVKFRTVRSTVWTLIATVVLMVGFSVLAAWGSEIGRAHV